MTNYSVSQNILDTSPLSLFVDLGALQGHSRIYITDRQR